MKFLDHKQSGGVSQFSMQSDRDLTGKIDPVTVVMTIGPNVFVLLEKCHHPLILNHGELSLTKSHLIYPVLEKTEITSKDVIRRVQALVENKTVKSIVGGRALTRTTDQFVH